MQVWSTSRMAGDQAHAGHSSCAVPCRSSNVRVSVRRRAGEASRARPTRVDLIQPRGQERTDRNVGEQVGARTLEQAFAHEGGLPPAGTAAAACTERCRAADRLQ